jgi:hypothetical protein
MALSGRTKLGITIAVSVIAGLASVSLAVLVLVLAVFLIARGQMPERTETFIKGLPGGNYLQGVGSNRRDPLAAGIEAKGFGTRGFTRGVCSRR